MNEIEVLKQFLEFPIWTSEPIFEKFRTINNCDFREQSKSDKERFLFIEGQRESKVVLVAHADTFFDEFYKKTKLKHRVIENNGFFYGEEDNGNPCGLGADDRAGCAILWLLKDSGHSLLITDGEEHGRIGSEWLMRMHPDIADKINQHQFMIQFDRRNGTDFKCYQVGTDAFREYIAQKTGYSEPDRSSYTDICSLCRDICGVNLSIGYYNEHTNEESINIQEWLHTLHMVKEILKHDLPRFEL